MTPTPLFIGWIRILSQFLRSVLASPAWNPLLTMLHRCMLTDIRELNWRPSGESDDSGLPSLVSHVEPGPSVRVDTEVRYIIIQYNTRT